MKTTRRDFLKTTAIATAALGVTPLAAAWPLGRSFQPQPLGSLSIVQTMTNATTAQFRVLLEAPLKVAYTVVADDGQTLPVALLDQYRHPSDQVNTVDHIQVSGLKPGMGYTLRILDASSGWSIDDRLFAAVDPSSPSTRFALISCMADEFIRVQQEMWRAVADTDPDFIFIIGDACYADEGSSGTEPTIWRRHMESRKSIDLYRWKKLKPVVSVWDDHDFGVNNGGEDFPLKSATRGMFEALLGSSATECFNFGPSLAREVSLFGQRFYLMDCRFFRQKKNKQGTHWGDEQEEWLIDRLSRSDEPAYIFNGSQFFGGYSGYEAFESESPVAFARLLKRLGQVQAPVVFGSGDVHFSELMRIEPQLMGYESFELTSSSLHSYYSDYYTMRMRSTNPRRMVADDHYNFLLIDSRPGVKGQLAMNVKSITRGGKILFEQDLNVIR